jgi:NADP-dependent 3-hydroxy acid dehydrogenase YdfG
MKPSPDISQVALITGASGGLGTVVKKLDSGALRCGCSKLAQRAWTLRRLDAARSRRRRRICPAW